MTHALAVGGKSFLPPALPIWWPRATDRAARPSSRRPRIAAAMFHPNRRYGNPAALRALTAGLTVKQISRLLHRHPRTVRDWLNERRPVPYWVPELLELRHASAVEDLRRMGLAPRPHPARVASLQAQRPGQAPQVSPGHAVPEPDEVGSAGRPGRGHGRAGGPGA